jgi:anti-sigma factor RsiW
MDWNCTFTEERLSDYLEGALAEEEREACAAHAAGCANCSEMLARVGALVGQMHALEPLREPAFLARRIIHNTARTHAQRHELARVTGWFSLIWQPRFAMGIATVAVTFVILAHAAGAQISRLRPNDLNPVNWVRAGNRQAHLTYARGEKFVNDLRVVYEIRAMLASPQAAPAQPDNERKPNPDSARPDTGEHHESRFRRDARIQNSRGTDVWAMLNLALGKSAPDPANRRPL